MENDPRYSYRAKHGINLLMTKINPEILKFAKVFIFFRLLLELLCIDFFQNNLWLLNTQVAFFHLY